MPDDDDRVARTVATRKWPAAALRDAGAPFAVAGGLAGRVRVGPLAVRQPVDWESVRHPAAGAPFARAVVTMVDGLGAVSRR